MTTMVTVPSLSLSPSQRELTMAWVRLFPLGDEIFSSNRRRFSEKREEKRKENKRIDKGKVKRERERLSYHCAVKSKRRRHI